jgi:peptidoglycan hydrolase-like protein with peptidoglycan-binding domain
MKYFRKLILEQEIRDTPKPGTTHEKLPADEQTGAIPSAKYNRQGCVVVKHTDGARYKECPENQPQTAAASSGYTGTYWKDVARNATVSADGDGLTLKYLVVNEYYLTPVQDTPDVFLNASSGVRATFRRDNQNKVIEMKLEFQGTDVIRNFGREVVLPKTSSDPGEGSSTSRIDLRQRYQLGGDFGCLEIVRKGLNRFPLLSRKIGTEDVAYEEISNLVDNIGTELVYQKDGTVTWRKRNDDNDILKTGKWECINANSYKIIWSDGKVTMFGEPSVNFDGSGSSPDASNQSDNSTNSVGCPSGYSETCPDESDVKNGTDSWKICMKCDKIKELQEIPALLDKIQKIQTREGKAQKTDIYFGPIMDEAVKLLQSERGLKVVNGRIGKETYESLTNNPGVKPTATPKVATTSGTSGNQGTSGTSAPVAPKPISPVKKINIFDPNADY